MLLYGLGDVLYCILARHRGLLDKVGAGFSFVYQADPSIYILSIRYFEVRPHMHN